MYTILILSLFYSEHEDDFSDGISIISESDNSHCSDSQTVTTKGSSAAQLEANKLKDLSNISNSSSEETDILRRELRLLRQQSQQLIEQGKELVIARNGSGSEFLASKVNITWRFVIFALTLILAFIGTLSHFWLSAPKDLDLIRRLDEVTAQNEILRLEIDNLFQIIERLKENRYSEHYDDGKNRFSKNKEKLKVWPGNGNFFDQIEIPKEALKSSYKCGDGKDDVAGFCITSDSRNPPPINIVEKPGKIEQEIVYEKEDFQDKKKHKNLKKKINSSEERKDKSNQSKERKYEKCKDCKNKHSGEKKFKNKQNYSKEFDGDWHDNMMKNREKLRKHKQKRDESDRSNERGQKHEQSRTVF